MQYKHNLKWSKEKWFHIQLSVQLNNDYMENNKLGQFMKLQRNAFDYQTFTFVWLSTNI